MPSKGLADPGLPFSSVIDEAAGDKARPRCANKVNLAVRVGDLDLVDVGAGVLCVPDTDLPVLDRRPAFSEEVVAGDRGPKIEVGYATCLNRPKITLPVAINCSM